MPFREKAKALFRPKSRSDSLSKTSSNTSSTTGGRHPSNVYKPGEPMPRPKYRKPPTKEHKEKLESFSFADAWRRKSFISEYSPMGTRAPSRRTSVFSIGKKSLGRSSRANSVKSAKSVEMEKHGVRPREGPPVAHGTRGGFEGLEGGVEEAEGDDDVANVGLSRVQSRDRVPLSRPLTADDQPRANGHVHHMSTAHDHQPFSEQDLALALSRSHLAVPAQ